MEKNQDQVYIPGKYFMIRSPLQSADHIPMVHNMKDYYDTVIDDNIMREAIAVSSIALHNSLNKDASKKEQYLSSLFAYAVRAASRSTPFGFMAGVNMGVFSDEEAIVRESSKQAALIKNVSIDMEWYFGIVSLLEEDDNVLNRTRIIFNPHCYICGNKMKNPYVSTVFSKEKNTDKIRVNYTKQLGYIKEFARESCFFSDLKDRMMEVNQDVPEQIIANYIKQLIKNEVLVTEFRRQFYSDDDPLDYLINFLQNRSFGSTKATDLLNGLIQVRELLVKYNLITVGEGIQTLDELYNKMASLYSCKSYIRCESAISYRSKNLPTSVYKELCKVGKLLHIIASADTEHEALIHFKRAFIEEYGIDSEIAITHLLDSERGLGNPFDNTFYPAFYHSKIRLTEKMEKLQKLLIKKMELVYHIGDKEIILTDGDIDSILTEEKIPPRSASLDLIFTIQSKSIECVKNGEFNLIIGENIGSIYAGNTFNRFYHVFNDTDKAKVLSIFEQNKNLYDKLHQPFVLFETPKSGRISNITRGNKIYKDTIHFAQYNESNSLSINDVYVGYDYKIDRLYLKANGKILRVINDNMLNESKVNAIAQFMRYVSNAYDSMPCFGIEKMRRAFPNQHHTLPIKYSQTIIEPETWRIFEDDVNGSVTYDKFIKIFLKLVKIYCYPRYVYQCSSDQRMFLDLESENCRKYIFSLVNKGRYPIVFTRTEVENLEQLILTDDKQKHYFSEFVVPFFINYKYELGMLEHDRIRINPNIEPARLCLGDKRWVYFKLYTNQEMADEILTEYLPDLLNELETLNVVNKFFFIKYADPNFHLRIRFQAKYDKDIHIIMKAFRNWFEMIRENGLSFRYTISDYQREYSRYGGYQLIEIAETVFYADSLSVIHLKQSVQNDADTEELTLLWMLYLTIKAFFSEFQEQLNFFESLKIEQNEYRKEYKKNRKKYMTIFDSAPISINNFKQVYEFRNSVLTKYAKGVFATFNEQGDIYNIIQSICHMFFNRYKCDRSLEHKHMCILRHSLYEYSSMLKHKNKKLLEVN